MGLRVRGVNFGNVLAASGTLGNFGEGYRYHRWIKGLPKRWSAGFDFTGATLVSKTATFAPREGNMPLDDNFQPVERFPKCIYVNHLQQIALNAVSLSNPGIRSLLWAREWQDLKEPFFISFMAANGKTEQECLAETEAFAREILRCRPQVKFSSRFGIQLNGSCPNTEHDPFEVVSRGALGQGKILRSILGDIPLDLKINAMIPSRAIKLIQGERVFDSLTCSNTIPWGELPEWIDWKKISRSGISPLIRRGFKQPGGLSGKPLLPIVERWLREARADGVVMPISGGGGILCPDDVGRLFAAGADAIALGSIAFLQWWNVKPCIDRANQLAERRRK